MAVASSEQIGKYLEVLRGDVQNREYVAVLESKMELPGVQQFVWLSRDFCNSGPTQNPDGEDNLALAVQNCGIRRVIAQFDCKSGAGKIVFGAEKVKNLTHKLEAPPRRAQNPVAVGHLVPISVTNLPVLTELLSVDTATSISDFCDDFRQTYELVLRF